MSQVVYVRYELLRTVRNRRFLIFSLAFPLILFLAVAGPNKNATIDGIHFPVYYLAGMASWGSMSAVMSSGARVAQERQIGWTRQLRVTPLRPRMYFAAKVVSGYLMALFAIAVLSLAATSVGVRLDVTQWSTMIGLLLVGLVPFVVLGIMLGHLVSVDSLGPVVGGGTSILALLGGAFGPLATSGTFLTVVKCLPSYWLVQAGRSALTGTGWPPEAWIVLALWTLALLRIAVLVYQRDTKRV